MDEILGFHNGSRRAIAQHCSPLFQLHHARKDFCRRTRPAVYKNNQLSSKRFATSRFRNLNFRCFSFFAISHLHIMVEEAANELIQNFNSASWVSTQIEHDSGKRANL